MSMIYRGEMPRKQSQKIIVEIRKILCVPHSQPYVEKTLGFYGPDVDGQSLLTETFKDLRSEYRIHNAGWCYGRDGDRDSQTLWKANNRASKKYADALWQEVVRQKREKITLRGLDYGN